MESIRIDLPSGLSISNVRDRLSRFCEEEYAFYDGIADCEPNQILPLDVIVTVAVNSFVNDAAKIRRVHKGIAVNCNPLLGKIPVDMDLQADDAALDAFEELITAALLTSGVLIPVAVKVLHRKRRSLIPMLDNVLLEFYLRLSGVARPGSLTQNKRTAGSAAVTALRLFRHDLVASAAELEYVRTTLGSAGYLLTPVRILEILVWSEVEPRGYYR